MIPTQTPSCDHHRPTNSNIKFSNYTTTSAPFTYCKEIFMMPIRHIINTRNLKPSILWRRKFLNILAFCGLHICSSDGNAGTWRSRDSELVRWMLVSSLVDWVADLVTSQSPINRLSASNPALFYTHAWIRFLINLRPSAAHRVINPLC